MVIIRQIVDDDAADYLALGHQLDRESTLLMLEPEERNWTVEEQRQRIINLRTQGGMIFVVEEPTINTKPLIGFLGAERGHFQRNRHSMYIVVALLKAFTGQGIGKRLFAELEAWCRTEGIQRLELTVQTHNVPALRLYQHCGFDIEGTKRRSLRISGQFVDEYYMGKIIG